jgi:hypothetical protein
MPLAVTSKERHERPDARDDQDADPEPFKRRDGEVKAEAHGGAVSVETEPGRGTTFETPVGRVQFRRTQLASPPPGYPSLR